jgi:thiol:disulfide interchange protein DsbA
VPTIIVDGKYVVQSKGSFGRMLEVVDYLVELQKPVS